MAVKLVLMITMTVMMTTTAIEPITMTMIMMRIILVANMPIQLSITVGGRGNA